MDIINIFKSNHNDILNYIVKLEESNKNYAIKLKNLEEDYNDLNKVSKIKEYDKQLFELKRENEFLKGRIEKMKIVNNMPKNNETTEDNGLANELPNKLSKNSEPNKVNNMSKNSEPNKVNNSELPEKEKEYETIVYKKINYFVDMDTNEIFTIKNNKKDMLVGDLINGKFKKRLN